MEEDLTASVWDDVLSPNTGKASIFANMESSTNAFASMDPFRSDNENESSANEHDHDDPEEAENPKDQNSDHYSEIQHQDNYQNEQLHDLKKEHTQQLLSELTNDSNGNIDNLGESIISPKRVNASESLFNVKDSPIKILPDVPTSGKRIVTKNSLKYRTNPRTRKYNSKSVVTHLVDQESTDADPLSLSNNVVPDVKSSGRNIIEETEAPLYEISPKKKKEDTLRELAKPTGEATPRPSTQPHPKLDIVVGDPIKVGEITNAYIVYSIRTRANAENFPKEVTVSRRYKDFRWIYSQLQQNHPGRIIPPPPSKQTYIGRFNESFIENRRLLLEKMLTKMSNISILCNDADFVMFLTSQDFNVDSKDRENDLTVLETSEASAAVAAAAADASAAAGSSGGFMSLFSITNKLADPDVFFTQKKQYIDELEGNLRQFYKSLELIGTQRLDLIGVLEEISLTLDELSSLEILKVTSDLLLAFSEVQLKLKENLDRINLQDQLTLGFTIEEYLRIIGSINHVFDTRLNIYQQFQTFSGELAKKQQQYDKLNKRYGAAPSDKIGGLEFEIGKLKLKSENYEALFINISGVIKEEIANFEFEKIEDFRNSVEIFIESSIESQKEAIELYETFFERQNLDAV